MAGPPKQVPPGEDDVLMNHKSLKVRADLIISLVVVAASITLAIWMHRTDRTYSCLKAPCPPLQIGYPVMDRLAVVAAGLLVAGLIIAIGTFTRRLGDSRTRHERTGTAN
jgi:hypothetical protein